MTDKQIVKTLTNIQKNCRKYLLCKECRFYRKSANYCLISLLTKKLSIMPSTWDIEKIEELINEK